MSPRPLSVVLLSTVLACAPDVDVRYETPDSTCATVIDGTYPSPDQADAYYRTPIEFTLSEADPDARVLTDLPGQHYTRAEGRVVGFLPGPPLTPASEYRAALDYCGGTPEITFHTDDIGTSLEAPVKELVGATYTLDLLSGQFLHGDTLATVASGFWDDLLLVSIADVDAEYLDLRIGTLGTELQSPCDLSVDLPQADFGEQPYFEVDDEALWLGVTDEIGLTLLDFSMSGTFSPSAETVQGVTMAGVLDLRELLPLMPGTAVSDLCQMAVGTGAPCEPCPDDDTPSCVHIQARDLQATRTDLSLQVACSTL